MTAACLAVVLTASACTQDDPKPNFSSVSPTPTVSSSSPPLTAPPSNSYTSNVPSGAISPTEPSTASQKSSDGAFAFVSYYWKQVDWAYSTVNGDLLNGLYSPTCKSCESSRSAINAVRAKGNSLEGGHLTIRSQTLAPADADPSAMFAVDTVLSVEPLTELTSSGAKVASYPATNYTVRAFVAWSEDHFLVVATANLGGGS